MVTAVIGLGEPWSTMMAIGIVSMITAVNVHVGLTARGASRCRIVSPVPGGPGTRRSPDVRTTP